MEKANNFVNAEGFFCTDCFNYFDNYNLDYDVTIQASTKYGTLNPNRVKVELCCNCCGGKPEILHFNPFSFYHIVAKIQYHEKNGIMQNLPNIFFYYPIYEYINNEYILKKYAVTDNYEDIEKEEKKHCFVTVINGINKTDSTIVFTLDFE